MSVALAESNALAAELFWHDGMKHAERLVSSIAGLLCEAGWQPAELARIAVSTGPGSFTGVRIGMTCARTMAQALGVPLTGVSALDVIAAGIPAGKNERVIGLVDALRDEVFVTDPSSGAVIIEPLAAVCKKIARMTSRVTLAGNSVSMRREMFRRETPRAILAPDALNWPRAGTLALMAGSLRGQPYTRVEPLYVRRSWAEEHRDAR